MTGVPRRRAILLGIAGAVLLALLVLGARAWKETRNREARLVAGLAGDVAEEMRALEADDPAPPDAENAALLYDSAFAVRAEDDWPLARKLDREWDRPPEDLARWVAANAGALALVERAAALDRCRFPTNWNLPGPSYYCPVPYGPPVQREGLWHFMAMLAARGRISLVEGRVAAAAGDAVLLTRVARHRARRDLRAGGGFAEEFRWTIGTLQRLLVHPALDAASARTVATGLLDHRRIWDDGGLSERSRLLMDEGQAWLLLGGRTSDKHRDALRKGFGLPPAVPLFGVSGADLDALEDLRDRWRSERERARRGGAPLRPDGAWDGMLALYRAAFAVRAFELEKGAPPARLEDLVPGLLPAVPEDPFRGGPLRLEVREGGWSVLGTGTVQAWTGLGQSVHLPVRVDFPSPPAGDGR